MLREILAGPLLAKSMLAVLATAGAANADGSATYGYDLDGRIRSVLYDDGLCVAYNYDANGNRTSQNNTLNGPENQATWGTGYFGCFSWTQ
jgi:hypothetical protein